MKLPKTEFLQIYKLLSENTGRCRWKENLTRSDHAWKKEAMQLNY